MWFSKAVLPGGALSAVRRAVCGLLDLVLTDADVHGLRPPALLIYGAESAPFEGLIGNRLHALRPDLRFITVDGAGHNVHRDRPDIVNPVTLSFLAPYPAD